MGDRKETRKQLYYTCGQCKTPIFYKKRESPVIPCPDCGWNHRDREKRLLPSEIRLPLNEY